MTSAQPSGAESAFGAPPARLTAQAAPHMPMERFPVLAVPTRDDVAYQNPAVIAGVHHPPTAVTGV
ncbi:MULTISPECIES: hypothetical protein [unclassified Streptomyces]|uniref:hypothetical protein n=1 Tax=unclassified Streptomyces TaxID=2593676 RepID=UPI0005A84928|nr:MULTISPECIES: hypothetical protein [unclassified Streptomyces]ODA73529.1 hypothetical protein APS67_002109 [Streptomyces sp. AVP053U2]